GMTSHAQTLARLLTALEEIESHAEANIERALTIQRKVRWMREQLDTGMPVSDVVEAETSPRVVALITTNKEALESAGAELRASLALALREDGLTLAEIAELFGVTRQRISALLRQRAALEVGSTPVHQGPS
ncbi:MAG: sigma factor-like helix-turn-helix DNA-binding protein, partial [Ornithinimicrobium sp.]